jgi:hypothetical protein
VSNNAHADGQKESLELIQTGRVNCALEKTNQSLSDEICRLKVDALRHHALAF